MSDAAKKVTQRVLDALILTAIVVFPLVFIFNVPGWAVWGFGLLAYAVAVTQNWVRYYGEGARDQKERT
jgi:hypothetical protein